MKSIFDSAGDLARRLVRAGLSSCVGIGVVLAIVITGLNSLVCLGRRWPKESQRQIIHQQVRRYEATETVGQNGEGEGGGDLAGYR